MNQFRIGACYRQRNGEVVRVISEEAYRGSHHSFHPTGKVLLTDRDGWRRVHDGAACNYCGQELEELSLLPGEVDERGNPISEQKAETVCEILSRLDGGIVNPAPVAIEPPKPALTWAKPKPFDPFKGFTTRSWVDFDELSRNGLADGPQHALQRLSDTSSALVAPGFGSAHLKG